MALGSNPYRKVFIDDMAKLQDLSVLAERAYIHLAFGQRSTACCLVRMKPDALRLELREHSRAKVTAALDELEAAGWVSIDRQTWTIALPVQAQRTPSENASVSQGKWKEAQKFPPSRQRDEVLNTIAEELARWEAQSEQRGKDSGKTVTRTSISSSIRSSIPSVAKATDTSATAAEAGAIANQAEPERDQSVWGNIKPTNPALLDSDYRPQSKLLPHLQHKLAVKDAVAKGILPAEPQQLAMDLPAGKTRKPLSDTQLDAIFAKRKMLEICNHWNEVMAAKNAPCVPKSIMAKAGTLMANVARFQHREPLEDARWLFDWAMAVDPYHSGRQGKPWTLQAWLSADHLSAVFAAYRTHKGDGKMLTLDLSRTIRDWRLAVETAELNNKIAEANNAY